VKKLLTWISTALVFVSCTKERLSEMPISPDLISIRSYLQSQLSAGSFARVKWDKAVPLNSGSEQRGYVIPMRAGGDTLRRIIALWENDNLKCTVQDIIGRTVNDQFTGVISTTQLSSHRQLSVVVDKNRITRQLPVSSSHTGIWGVAGQATEATDLSVSFGTYTPPAAVRIGNRLYYWVNMTGGWGPTPTTPQQPVVSYLNADHPGDDANGGGSGGSAEMVEVEYHDWEAKPGVDIEKLFNCFDAVPEFPGTSYEISLCSDVPMNKYPYEVANILLSPGHVFISITKSCSGTGVSVTQNFGFYPVRGKNSLGLDDGPSKVVNDANHEYNAKITIPMSVNSFNSIRANASIWAAKPYNIKNYNCGDFAIDLFNLARFPNEQITVPPFPIEGVIPFINTSFGFWVNKSPQMLFKELKFRKDNNTADAPHIIIDQTGNKKVGASNGECD
jgi:hypothetical protein